MDHGFRRDRDVGQDASPKNLDWLGSETYSRTLLVEAPRVLARTRIALRHLHPEFDQREEICL